MSSIIIIGIFSIFILVSDIRSGIKNVLSENSGVKVHVKIVVVKTVNTIMMKDSENIASAVAENDENSAGVAMIHGRKGESETGSARSRNRKRSRSPTSSQSELDSDDSLATKRKRRERRSRLEEENLRLVALLTRRERAPMDLVKFDPKSTDATGWAKMVDEWIRRYKPDDWKVVQHLAKAFKNEAAQWFTGMDPSGKSWTEIRAEFMSAYAKNKNVASELHTIWTDDAEFTLENFMKRGRKIKAWLKERKSVDETATQLAGLSYSFNNRFVRNIFIRESPRNLQEAMSYLDGKTTDHHRSRAPFGAPGPHTKTSTQRDGKSHRSDIECFNCGKKGHRKADCRSSSKSYSSQSRDNKGSYSKRAVTCYNCKGEGHISPNCPQKEEKTVKLCSLTSTEGTLKLAEGKVLTFTFDSGSDCSLVGETLAEKLPGRRQCVSTRLRGIGNGYVDCCELISVWVDLDGINVEIDLYAVPDGNLLTDLLLGKELLSKVSVKLDGITIKFSKLNRFVGSCSLEIDVNAVDCDSVEMRKPLIELLKSYSKHMSVEAPKTRVTAGKLEIRLKDENKLVQRGPYRLGTVERETVRALVEKMLKAGIVRESKSPFSSPIILVKKKDGSDRLCVDFRELNSNTVADRYPLPLIQDQLDRLCGAQYFSSLDMVAGFHQIPVEENSIEKLAFITPDGHYEYLTMPFGLMNAPSVYQRAINDALGELRYSYAIVYLDDVLIPGKTEQEALDRLKVVMEKLAANGFSFNLNKCKFLKTQIDYLGYTVSKGELRPNLRKIEALVQSPIPRTQTQVRQLLGLASYFRRFIPKFSQTAAPLYRLTAGKTKAIKWTNEHSNARTKLVECLTSEPLLRIFDPSLPIELHTDASALGYGAVLLQKVNKEKHPIAYYSKRTIDAETRYHSYELETLAVVNAIKHFRQYLVGRKFLVVTDCNSLKAASLKKDLTPRVYRWWAFLQSFDFEIEYRAGERMKHADFLSRNPVPEDKVLKVVKKDMNKITELADDWLIVAQQKDDGIKALYREVLDGSEATKTYSIKDRILMRTIERKGKQVTLPVVPRLMVWSLIHHVHENICHLGWEKTLDKLYELYWFPHMSKQVKKFVANCILCQTCKSVSRPLQAQLHPIEKDNVPWFTIHIDISGKLSGPSEKKEYVFVIVDGFTKFVTLNWIDRLDTETAINQIEKHSFTFGVPKRIICDQGAGFTNQRFKEFCNVKNILIHLIASGTPRANGQVERIMSTMRNMLSVGKAQGKQWQNELGRVQLALNSTVHKTLGKSPAEILFGTKINSIEIERVKHDSVITDSADLSELRTAATDSIRAEGAKEKARFDKKNKTVNPFKIGDFVMVRNNDRIKTKLDAKYRGPVEIVAVLPNDRYLVKKVGCGLRGRNSIKVSHDKLIAAPGNEASQDSYVAETEKGENETVRQSV